MKIPLFKNKIIEQGSCRYCMHAKRNENDKLICKFFSEVKGSHTCRRYKFDPFAHRTPRLRNVDTTMFDPLDFKIE